RQSERRGLYDAAIDRLTAAGLTYPCWCSRREVLQAPAAPHAPPGAYPGTCRDRPPPRTDRPPALRLRAGDAPVAVDDRLHGRAGRGGDRDPAARSVRSGGATARTVGGRYPHPSMTARLVAVAVLAALLSAVPAAVHAAPAPPPAVWRHDIPGAIRESSPALV